MSTTIDAINFFSAYSLQSWLVVFPGGSCPGRGYAPLLREDGLFSFQHRREKPLTDLSLKNLKEAPSVRPILRKVDRLLKAGPQSDLDQLFLSAIQWAGRAGVERRREESFLLLAIALESIMLPHNDARELSYRLRIRVAHLLAATATERRKISKEVGMLYGIRSKIVHNGVYEVTDNELARLRSIVKQTILTILTDRAVAGRRSKKGLEQWFESRILS